MPSTMLAMLNELDVHEGQKVLEIGTGTGYNTALLAHRLGAGNVVSIKIDLDIAQQAGANLAKVACRVGERGRSGARTATVPVVPTYVKVHRRPICPSMVHLAFI